VTLPNIGSKPVTEEVGAITRFLNREANPLLRKLRSLLGRHEETFGDGVNSVYDFRHGLGTMRPSWTVQSASTGEYFDLSTLLTTSATDEDTLSLAFPAPIPVDSFVVVIRV